MDKKKKNKGQRPLSLIHQSFKSNFRDLMLFVNNLIPIVTQHDKSTMEKIKLLTDRLFQIAGISVEELKRRKKFKLAKGQAISFIKVSQEIPRLGGPQVALLYKSSFVLLISYFDFLLSDLIHYYYQEFPEALSGKDLSLTLSDLKACGDLDEAIKCVVNKEIDKVLYANLVEQKRYFQNNLKIDLKENIINWNTVNEAIERRNIIVHNDSKINKRYLSNIDRASTPEDKKKLKEGSQVSISEEYFTNIYEELLVAGTMIMQGCWRKWEKDALNLADTELISDIYGALSEERWKVAERLGIFSKEFKMSNERNRLYLDINYCQSLKWQNKERELKKEIENFDISILSPKYVVAIAALKSDKKKFYENIEKAIKVDEMEKEDFMEWPLFRELRKDPDYEENINKLFNSSQKKE